jgi:hypothetical protein
MSKDKTQTTTTQLDPATQAWQSQFMRPLAGEGARIALQTPMFNPNTNQLYRGAVEGATGLGFGGSQEMVNAMANFGMGALGTPVTEQAQSIFDQGFTPNVIGSIQQETDRQLGLNQQRANQLATQSQAFGGSRHGVLEAMGARDIGDVSQRNIANVSQQQAMQQQGLGAGVLGGALQRQLQMGQFGTGIGMQAGEHMRQLQQMAMQNPVLMYQNALQMANMGLSPYGTSVTGPAGGTNPIGSAAGGAMAGGAVGGPYGAAIGGGVGLLGGLFG